MFIEAGTLPELREAVRNADRCHFGEKSAEDDLAQCYCAVIMPFG